MSSVFNKYLSITLSSEPALTNWPPARLWLARRRRPARFVPITQPYFELEVMFIKAC